MLAYPFGTQATGCYPDLLLAISSPRSSGRWTARQCAQLRKKPCPLLLRQVRPLKADAQRGPPPLHAFR